MGNKVKTWV